ncbi:MAG: hypothetical protein HQ536_01585 [Parcubacteria group bacterium]|nr:hypothetical protein [Parcubacteria group bacterium]
MKIAFLIERDIYYKLFGCMIDEALKRGHQVFCLHDYSQSKEGPKGYQFPWLSKVLKFQSGTPQAISFTDRDEFLKAIEEQGIQVVVVLKFLPHCLALQKELKKCGVFIVALQFVGDIVNEGNSVGLPDRYFIYSDTWLELSLGHLSDQGVIKEDDIPANIEKLKKTVKSTGFSELDQARLINPDTVRAGWGIPKGKPVVLFLPFPFHCTSDRFWAPFIYGFHNRLLQLPIALLSLNRRYIRQVWNRWNDKRVVMAVKKFCEKNNAFLLVKARKKEPPRKYLTKIADKVIYHDDSYYPATILKCLKISDVCLNFFSFTVLEAIFLGVPNVCIAPSSLDYKNIQGSVWSTILGRQKQLFDFSGAAYTLSIPQAIAQLPKKLISDFPLNPEKQSKYVQKFVGPLDGNHSSRAMTEIENLVLKSKT